MLTVLRVLWIALGVLAAPALTAALDGTSSAVAAVAVALAALGWGAGIVAVLLPRSASLTALRLLAPSALGGAVACVTRVAGPATIAALVVAAVMAGVLLLDARVADLLVDGSSYGPERRFALRTPLALLLGPVELAWAVVAVPAVLGPLLLAAHQWIAGGVVLVTGAALGRRALDSLHQLSRRWVVFVPAGFVLHDPVVLLDPVLFPKRRVRSLAAAPVDAAGEATDLTRGAPGLVLELRLGDPVDLGVVERRRQGRTISSDRLLFTPGRPGAVLAEARSRGFPGQEAMPPPRTSSPS